MSRPLTTTASYLRPIWDDPDRMIEIAKRETDKALFDTIIGTGLSGAMFVPLLGNAMGCYWAVARKSNDGTHSMQNIEGQIGERWLFIDDLVDSGATLERTKRQVKRWCDEHQWSSEYAGAYLYYNKSFYPPEHDFEDAWYCRCSRCEPK